MDGDLLQSSVQVKLHLCGRGPEARVSLGRGGASSGVKGQLSPKATETGLVIRTRMLLLLD